MTNNNTNQDKKPCKVQFKKKVIDQAIFKCHELTVYCIYMYQVFEKSNY